MQEDELLFKVPTMKKHRPTLYCTETLSDLDEVWDSPKTSLCIPKSTSFTTTSNTADHGSPQRSVFKLEYEKAESDIVSLHQVPTETRANYQPTTVADDYGLSFALELFLSSGSNNEDFFNVSQNKYTVGLLDELNKNTLHFNCSGSPPALLHQQFVSENMTDGYDGSITSVSNDKSLLTTCDAETCFPHSPDVLIVRDESMANADSDLSASDLEWESLTPPVPSSPQDHIVPDFTDLTTITPLSNLPYPDDHLSSVFQNGDLMISEDESYNSNLGSSSNLQFNNSHLSFDHVVPEF